MHVNAPSRTELAGTGITPGVGPSYDSGSKMVGHNSTYPTVYSAIQAFANANLPAATVSSMAALRLVSGAEDGQTIALSGYSSENDGGGGIFVWNSTSTVADDKGTIIAPTGVGTGRWYRLMPTAQAHTKWFGCAADGVTNDTAALGYAHTWYMTTNNAELLFDAGTYLVTSSYNWAASGSRIIGIGTVIILYSGTLQGLLFDAGSTAGTFVNDCYADNFIIDGSGSGSATATSGFYSRGITKSTFNNIRVKNVSSSSGHGFDVIDNVLVTFNCPSCSKNEFPGSTMPSSGIYSTKRTGGGGTSACQFNNVIMEFPTTGINLNSTARCIFTGTAEDCTTGISEDGYCVENTFIGMDLESNVTVDWVSSARSSRLINGTIGTLLHFTGAAFQCAMIGGDLFAATVDSGATGCHFTDIYEVPGGTTISDSGTYTSITSRYKEGIGIAPSIVGNGMQTGSIILTGAVNTNPGAGNISIGGSLAATATAGTGTLPSNPSGFVEMYAGTTLYKIPYYAA